VLPHFDDGKLKVCIGSTIPVDWKDPTPVKKSLIYFYPNLLSLDSTRSSKYGKK